MFNIIFNKNFPHKKLKKSITLAIEVLLIQAVFFWINVIFNSGLVVFTSAGLYILIMINVFGAGAFMTPKGNYDEEFYNDLEDLCVYIILHYLGAIVVGIYGFCIEPVSEVAQSYPISLYIFYGLNLVGVVVWRIVLEAARSSLEDVRKKNYEVNRFKKGTNVEYDVKEIKSKYKEIYSGLNDTEIDIVKPTLLKIYTLWEKTFDKDYNLIRPNAFWEVLDFLNNYKKIIDTYKKGKGKEDLKLLKDFNKLAEDFYNAINPKEQVLKKEDFTRATTELSIKLRGL